MQRDEQEPVREPTASISQSLRRWTSRLSCLLVWCAALLIAAACVGTYALVRRVPRARRGVDSVRPWLPPGESVDVSIYLTPSGDREALRDAEQPTLVLRNLTDDVSVTVPVPPATRLHGVPLWAHVCVRLPPIDAELEETEHCVGAAPLTLRRPWIEKRANGSGVDEELPGTALFWRFEQYPLVLRLLDVGGDGALDAEAARDGHALRRLGLRLDVNGTVYKPVAFVDDALALWTEARVLSRNLSHPDPTMLFRVARCGVLSFVVRREMRPRLALGRSGAVADGQRRRLRDESVWRTCALLALKFGYGVAYLYLLDLGADQVMKERVAREIVRYTVAPGVAPAVIVLLVALHNWPHVEAASHLYLGTFPLVFGVALYANIRDGVSYYLFSLIHNPNAQIELITSTVDNLIWFHFVFVALLIWSSFIGSATRAGGSMVYFGAVPLLAAATLYAFIYDEQSRTLNDWFAFVLTDLFYYIGFVAMVNQVLINYRLKSVARLPTKLLVYKIIATFADDAYAWLLEMPPKFWLMTLRDDVVFVVFLYQWWAYRVDGSRQHEYHWRR